TLRKKPGGILPRFMTGLSRFRTDCYNSAAQTPRGACFLLGKDARPSPVFSDRMGRMEKTLGGFLVLSCHPVHPVHPVHDLPFPEPRHAMMIVTIQRREEPVHRL
ncbi:MAG: hypothetical protein LBU11_09090, partial [Zoogloeaceae bacterium]|nr:hypothetical protein [Zoogloeaceae bacterium]